MNENLDLIIVGAGPAGLACAIFARRSDLNVLILEKGCLVNSIYHFPENMTFFTTADLLEIGEIPMTSTADKPKRRDALVYYRRVADYYGLRIHDFEKVVDVEGADLDFRVTTEERFGGRRRYRSRKLAFATGYYDNPNLLGVPGEDLPKVSHYYNDPHPFHRKKVAVIGGKNSAAIAALELYRGGAEVTLIHRGPAMGREVKYWILPDIENRIKNREVTAWFNSTVREIRSSEIAIRTPEGDMVLENDYVFALTGYHPDPTLLRSLGVEVDSDSYLPRHDPTTLETNVPGVYLAGSVVSGRMTNRIFIENGRFHGGQIVPHIKAGLDAAAVGRD